MNGRRTVRWEGVRERNEHQPHAKGSCRSPMHGQIKANRRAVPCASGARLERLPDAWRSWRRANWQAEWKLQTRREVERNDRALAAHQIAGANSGMSDDAECSLRFSFDCKARAYLGGFGFELRQTVTQRADRLGDFLFGEAWRDVLLTIPIERFQVQAEDTFKLGLVVRHGDERDQVRVIVEREGFD